MLTYLRSLAATSGLNPMVRFRAGIGVGGISVHKRTNPYEEDGEAFVRSRRALQEVQDSRSPSRWTKITTGPPALDRQADVVLCLVDHALAEYFLVGTLTSTGVAIIGGLALINARAFVGG